MFLKRQEKLEDHDAFSLTHSFTCACDGHFTSLQPLEKCENKKKLVTKGFKLLAIN
jgi:hypothetical protein